MIEKVKNFFAAMASTAVLLYSVGYMAENSHAGMLGISLVDPFRESYLISGEIRDRPIKQPSLASILI